MVSAYMVEILVPLGALNWCQCVIDQQNSKVSIYCMHYLFIHYPFILKLWTCLPVCLYACMYASNLLYVHMPVCMYICLYVCNMPVYSPVWLLRTDTNRPTECTVEKQERLSQKIWWFSRMEFCPLLQYKIIHQPQVMRKIAKKNAYISWIF